MPAAGVAAGMLLSLRAGAHTTRKLETKEDTESNARYKEKVGAVTL